MMTLYPELRPWLVIGIGLMIGLMARWAVMQSASIKVGWREIRIDFLILLANGLLAAQFAEATHIDGVKLAVAAAMFGASSTMIFSAIHTKFVAAVSKAPVQLFMGPGETVELPAIDGPIIIHAVAKADVKEGKLK